MEKREIAYMKLQNGSDIRGIALEGVSGEEVNITEAMVRNIAMAFVSYISDKKGIAYHKIHIGVGHDSRLSASKLKRGIIDGTHRKGAMVYDCGLTSTPSMFMSTILDGFQYDGAIMITASHLPFNRNGLKFFTKEGGLESADIGQILKMAAMLSGMDDGPDNFTAPKADLAEAYTEHLRQIIKQEVKAENYDCPLEGLHIVIDASNGVSGYFRKVLEPLGASTDGSICLEPDGTFPNHVPNPENADAMRSIRNAVLASKADLGVIFDTDGDRAAVVFANGEEVNKNAIIALMAAILSERYPNTTVVTDSVTSNYLTEFLEDGLHMKHHRFKRGYKNVINEAIRLNSIGEETHLAIETSGHGALKENYFLDDGAYMSVKIICKLAQCKKEGRGIESLISTLKKPEVSKEYRLKILADDYKAYGEKLLADFKEFAANEKNFHIVQKNYEGIRVEFEDDEVTGWMLIRMSLHDLIIPINLEADQQEGEEVILERLEKFLNQYKEIGNLT